MNQQPQRQQQLAPAAADRHPNPSVKGNAWLQGAPATKIVLAGNVLLHMFLIHSPHDAALLQLDSYAMRHHHGTDWYRYFTSKLTFGTTGELIVGTSLLLFLMRKYERELSTRKLVALYGYTLCLGVVQEMVCLQLLVYRNRIVDLPQDMRWQYAGPYPVVGALFTLFHWTAPRVHPRFMSILGLQFSEKSLYYLWFLHLIASGGWNTAVPTLTGCLAALLYLTTPLKDVLQVPEGLVRSVQPALDRLGLSDAPGVVAPPTARGLHQVAAALARQAGPVQQQQQQQQEMIPAPEPDAAAIEQLTNMGFPRQRVMEALRQTHNNVEHAANRLLTDTA